MKFRKKPVVIEAIIWKGSNYHEVKEFINDKDHSYENGSLYIHTLEGKMRATNGDYIVRGVCGEYYPCKPDIFELTYEKVSNETVS